LHGELIYYNTETGEIRKPFYIDGVISCDDPLYIEGVIESELCSDEGDYDTCDDGYVDRGYGCEPKDDNEGNDNSEESPEDPKICAQYVGNPCFGNPEVR